MITAYILVLTFSAALLAFCAARVAERMEQVLSLRLTQAGGIITLMVTLSFLLVVAAPSWVILLALVLLVVPHRWLTDRLAATLQWHMILLLLVPLLVLPLLAAPSWVALDCALIASAILGCALARQTSHSPGSALLSLMLVIGWLAVSSVMHLISGASHA